MRLADGGVDQHIFEVWLCAQHFEKILPNTGQRPAPEPRMYHAPVSQFRRQIAPRRCPACQPKDRIDKKPVISACASPKEGATRPRQQNQRLEGHSRYNVHLPGRQKRPPRVRPGPWPQAGERQEQFSVPAVTEGLVPQPVRTCLRRPKTIPLLYGPARPSALQNAKPTAPVCGQPSEGSDHATDGPAAAAMRISRDLVWSRSFRNGRHGPRS